jgi:hypothetical protein
MVQKRTNWLAPQCGRDFERADMPQYSGRGVGLTGNSRYNRRLFGFK